MLGMRLLGCVRSWQCFHADLVLRLWHSGGNPSPILDKASLWLHRLKQPLQWSGERPGAVQPCLDQCSFWPSRVSTDFPQLLSSVICLPVCHAISEKNLRGGTSFFFLRKGEACSDYRCLAMLVEISENTDWLKPSHCMVACCFGGMFGCLPPC